jgi:hypothetical protein
LCTLKEVFSYTFVFFLASKNIGKFANAKVAHDEKPHQPKNFRENGA